jgi:FG-GAP repeat
LYFILRRDGRGISSAGDNPPSEGGLLFWMPSDLFGYSVAISGTTILAGAHLETAMGFNNGGHAYIF